MVVWGSLSLAQSFIRENVIDEYQLIVCPVVLGRGRPLFDESDASLDLKLLRTQSFDHGSVLLSYAPAID
jgi:dihydrofolate reductase